MFIVANMLLCNYNIRRNMFKLRNKEIKSVGFLGLGKSNLGAFEYLSRHQKGLSITVRSNTPVDVSAISPSRVFFGKEALSSIDEDILFISPSARRDLPELAEAFKKGVILFSDAELFFEATSSDVYAVTGSDGKSTTTHLSSILLKDSYRDAVACGNIGVAMSPCLDTPDGVAFVTELSSFQLNCIEPKSERCIITNITENHLNWHTSFEEYINAKRNVLVNGKKRIINYDCEISQRLSEDFDVFAVFSTENNEKQLRAAIKAEIYVTLSSGHITVSGEPILNISDIKLPGRHNILNFMGAAALCHGLYKKESLTNLAREFGGLPHRCELVGALNGVSYYDSSIDSSPKRCAATLDMFKGAPIVILGGRSKGLDYSLLIPSLRKKAKHAVITGECAGELEALLAAESKSDEKPIPYTRIDDFYDAVDYAVSIAERGDAVLLSPAATSYDKFANFEQRGNAFKMFLKSKGI